MKEEKESFFCACYSFEHQAHFWYNEEWNSIFVYFSLIPSRNLFKRIWYAIKYVFGYQSRFGQYDEFIINNDDLDRYIEYFKKVKSASKSKKSS